MRYSITRECWNENTYNGYTDNPYWRVSFQETVVGLHDDGEYWIIRGVDNDASHSSNEHYLSNIIDECKLSIKLRVH